MFDAGPVEWHYSSSTLQSLPLPFIVSFTPNYCSLNQIHIMKFSTTAVAAFAAVATASPLIKRTYTPTDADILNYALTLEHLEDKFYREGLANFTLSDFQSAGYDEAFYNNIKEVSYDETTHVSFLTTALTAAGAMPVAECTYAFGVTSVQSFLATASVLEGMF
jgi:hypothetical protein